MPTACGTGLAPASSPSKDTTPSYYLRTRARDLDALLVDRDDIIAIQRAVGTNVARNAGNVLARRFTYQPSPPGRFKRLNKSRSSSGGVDILLRLAGVKPNSDAIRIMISACRLAIET
jgi:hypothetical protein